MRELFHVVHIIFKLRTWAPEWQCSVLGYRLASLGASKQVKILNLTELLCPLVADVISMGI